MCCVKKGHLRIISFSLLGLAQFYFPCSILPLPILPCREISGPKSIAPPRLAFSQAPCNEFHEDLFLVFLEIKENCSNFDRLNWTRGWVVCLSRLHRSAAEQYSKRQHVDRRRVRLAGLTGAVSVRSTSYEVLCFAKLSVSEFFWQIVKSQWSLRRLHTTATGEMHSSFLGLTILRCSTSRVHARLTDTIRQRNNHTILFRSEKAQKALSTSTGQKARGPQPRCPKPCLRPLFSKRRNSPL